MNATNEPHETLATNWYRESDCSLEAFAQQLQRKGDVVLRFAAETQRDIPIYDCRALDKALIDPVGQRALQAEWANVLLDGAGVLVLKSAFHDTSPVDDATHIFDSIIRQERESGARGADHFAKAGANDRIWNAHESCVSRRPPFSRVISRTRSSRASRRRGSDPAFR